MVSQISIHKQLVSITDSLSNKIHRNGWCSAFCISNSDTTLFHNRSIDLVLPLRKGWTHHRKWNILCLRREEANFEVEQLHFEVQQHTEHYVLFSSGFVCFLLFVDWGRQRLSKWPRMLLFVSHCVVRNYTYILYIK